MNPHRRRSALARRSALTLALFFALSGCGPTQTPPALSGPAGSPSAGPAGPSSTAEPAVGTSPSPDGSPSPARTPKPGNVKDVDWYISRLPVFGPLPEPDVQDVDHGPESPVWKKVPTTQNVAFLTIDDGALRHPLALPLLKASGVRVTLFLTINYVQQYPDYFKALQAAGAVIENHTFTHTDLRGKSVAFQRHEICDAADRLGQIFGRRPTLFRPPYGDYDDNTLRIAHSCGQKVVLYWSETVDKGIVRYQIADHRILPGHIVLMHFRPAYGDDFLAALTRMKASGVQPALLEDYIQGACDDSCNP